MARSLVAVLLLSAGGVLAAPTPEQIDKAVADLASPRFAVRERASKVLWEAGRAAEVRVREAARSQDEETANRARAILEKFDWGLYPDTPADVVQRIETFRGGDSAVRQQVVGELMRLKPARFDTLRKLIAQEQDPNARRQMYQRMASQAREAVPGLIVAGKLDDANELLEICLAPGSPASLGDYAAFQYLRKQVPAAIARLEAVRAKGAEADARAAAEALVYLYRVKQDWAAAAKAAAVSQNTELQTDVAWEASDWQRLAEGPTETPAAGLEDDRGARAAYHRLAGNRAKYDEIIGELRQELEGVEGGDSSAYTLAYALLLNGEGGEAIKVLRGRNRGGADLVFDLLCAQFKFKDAFDYAAAAKKELNRDPDALLARDQLTLREARMLAGLGDRDGATQLFRSVLDTAHTRRQDRMALEVVKVIARSGMRDLATDTVARSLAGLENTERWYQAGEFLRTVFKDRSPVVLTWWLAIRADDPKAEPAASMARVREFLTGTADRAKADRLAERIRALGRGPVSGDGISNTILIDQLVGNKDFATAEAYRAVGAADKAEAFYKKATDDTAGGANQPQVLLDLVDIEELGTSTPAPYRYRLAYADFLAEKKRHREAAAVYRKAWEAAPAQPLPLFLCGHALTLAGDAAEGKRLMDLAHWVPLGNEATRTQFSDDLAKRGFEADSKRETDLILSVGWFRTHHVGNIYLRVARQKARQGDYAAAARLYEKDVVSLFRTGAGFVDPKAYLTVPELARTYRARALLAAGKPDEAMTEARAGLAVLPANIELALGLVPDLDRAGMTKEADEVYTTVKAAYESAIDQFGSSADLRNGLAWTMANCNRDLDRALAHAKKAVELAPKTAGYLDTLAEVHFRKKDRETALELMKQCAAVDPTNPYYQKQLVRFAKKPFDSPLPDEETGEE